MKKLTILLATITIVSFIFNIYLLSCYLNLQTTNQIDAVSSSDYHRFYIQVDKQWYLVEVTNDTIYVDGKPLLQFKIGE